MSLLVDVRSHHRARQVRVTNSAGALVVLSPDISTTVDLDNEIVRVQLGHHTAVGQWYTVASNGGGGAAGAAARVLGPFPFAFDDAGLNNGITFYTPTIGDILLDAWVEVDTAFDGTTPSADIGTFSGNTHGLFASSWDVIPLGNPDVDYGGAGVLISGVAPATSLVGVSGGETFARTAPGRFIAAHPLKIVASQNGQAGGAALDSTTGSGTVYLVVATPALS